MLRVLKALPAFLGSILAPPATPTVKSERQSSLTCITLYSGIIYKFLCLAMKWKYRIWLNCVLSHTLKICFVFKMLLDSGSDFLLSFLKGFIEKPTLAGRLLPLTFPTANVGDDSEWHPLGFSLPIHKHLIVQQRAKAFSDLKPLCSRSWSSGLFLAHLYYISSFHNTSQSTVTLQTSPSY